ncbi:hypothetical protein PLESTB_001355200 [Pleodorina starrii]|uniref:Uncharacterized protein n=1 Tax=Pleodorina starrii TaxID=330485 RepID=A0A9W6BUW5_9CHLO|nr:hypothetical protein PLESTB_001355200 [Pleodorina starrii]
MAPWGYTWFTDVSARWIWARDFGSTTRLVYLKKAIYVASPFTVTMHIVVDDNAAVYVNDVFIAYTNLRNNGGSGHTDMTITLSTGTNRIVVRAQNTGGFIAGALIAITDNASGVTMAVSDSTWAYSAEEAHACDCNYHSGGCSMSIVPSPATACHCSYKGWWTCTGWVVACADWNDYYCQNPGGNWNTCHQGGGDCGAY